MRRPIESAQYTSEDYTQQLDDAKVLASVGSVGDCYDNALAESFVDSYKTELIADRVWRTNAQLELATVDYVSWFNHRRLHTSIDNRPPIEHEREYWAQVALGFETLPAQPTPIVADLRDLVTVDDPDIEDRVMATNIGAGGMRCGRTPTSSPAANSSHQHPLTAVQAPARRPG